MSNVLTSIMRCYDAIVNHTIPHSSELDAVLYTVSLGSLIHGWLTHNNITWIAGLILVICGIVYKVQGIILQKVKHKADMENIKMQNEKMALEIEQLKANKK